MSDLAAIIERRYLELLDDTAVPECAACGRKPMSPTQLTQALRGAVQYLASKTAPPSGGTPGSALLEDEDNA